MSGGVKEKEKKRKRVGFSTEFWELPGKCFEAILAPLVGFWAPFWAPAGPEGSPKTGLFHEKTKKTKEK